MYEYMIINQPKNNSIIPVAWERPKYGVNNFSYIIGRKREFKTIKKENTRTCSKYYESTKISLQLYLYTINYSGLSIGYYFPPNK